MTKEEMKALVASKIASQGNQVDVSGTLATLLNEIIDGMPESPVTINLGEIFLPYFGNNEEDVTEYFGSDYTPKLGDSVIYYGKTYLLSSFTKSDEIMDIVFGNIVDSITYSEAIIVTRRDDGIFHASKFEI